jgi:transposase
MGRPLIVVWDRLPAHRAKKGQEFLTAHEEDYQVEWLPPYSPELNPEEPCHGVVKQEMLNALPSSPRGVAQLSSSCLSASRLPASSP